MRGRIVAATALLLAVALMGCGNDRGVDSSAVSTINSADWTMWRQAQTEPSWLAVDRDKLTRGVLASVRYNVDQGKGQPVEALAPVALVMMNDGSELPPLGVYPLDEALWGSSKPEDRARALADLGGRVRRDATGTPVAVFVAAAGWQASASDVGAGTAPSQAASRQRVLLAYGLWCDGSRASVIEPVESLSGDAFVVSVPTTESVEFDDASTAPDGGGTLAFFYKGYFADLNR